MKRFVVYSIRRSVLAHAVKYRALSAAVFTILLLAVTVFPSLAASPPYFYAVSPSEESTQLIEINPVDASIVSTVYLYHANGGVPDIQTFSLAFDPAGGLFGWDATAGQLFNINYTSQTTAQIDYIGSPTGTKVTGLAFDNLGG
ncbi:MAG: hypothetical protein AB1499_00615, partial [Nitrospirota bacterium]